MIACFNEIETEIVIESIGCNWIEYDGNEVN